MKTPPGPGSLPRRVHAGYALGSLATGAFGTVPGLLLLPYLTDTLGVAAGLAALLVLLPKAWDVLVNPVAGRISDRTRSRWGARRPYLIVAGLALAVLFASIFAAPFGNGPGAAAYVAFAFLATATAFAFFQVPYVAMPAELTDDYAERTRLMTWRIAVLALAILVSGAVAPLVVSAGGDGVAGHRWMGLFVAVLIALGALGAFLGTRSAPTGTVGESEPTLRAQLAVAGANRPFRALLICFVVQSAGVATILAGVNYFAGQILRDEESGPTLLFVCFVGPALLVMPIWSRIGARLGKRTALVVASLILAVGAFALVAAPVLPAGRRLSPGRADRRGVRRAAGLRAGDVAGLHRARDGAHRPTAGGRLHRAVDRRGDLRPGARPRYLRTGAPALRLRVLRHRLGGGPVRHGEAGRPPRLHADPGPADRPADPPAPPVHPHRPQRPGRPWSCAGGRQR